MSYYIQVADAAKVPNGMRPYFLDVAHELEKIYDYQALYVYVLPVLLRFVYCCEIYASPSEMATTLIDFLKSQMVFKEGPGGIKLPDIPHAFKLMTDPAAEFLAAVATRFITDHPGMMRDKNKQ